MCHLFHVMHLPFVVSWIMYHLSWWLWWPVPTIIPWVHGLPFSHWTLQLTLWEYMQILVKHHCYFSAACLPVYCDGHHHSCLIGLWSKTGMMPWTCLLNINVARLGKSWPNGIVHICSRAIFISLPKWVHFFKCVFYKFDTGFDLSVTLMVISQWYCLLYIDCLTELLDLSDTKLVPASDIIFWGIPYLANIILTVLIRLSTDNPSNLLMTGNLLL